MRNTKFDRFEGMKWRLVAADLERLAWNIQHHDKDEAVIVFTNRGGYMLELHYLPFDGNVSSIETDLPVSVEA